MHEFGVLVLDPLKAAPYRSFDLPLRAICLVPNHSFPSLRFGVVETPRPRRRWSFILRIGTLVPRWIWLGDPACSRQIRPCMPLHLGSVVSAIAVVLEPPVGLGSSKPRWEVVHDLWGEKMGMGWFGRGLQGEAGERIQDGQREEGVLTQKRRAGRVHVNALCFASFGPKGEIQ